MKKPGKLSKTPRRTAKPRSKGGKAAAGRANGRDIDFAMEAAMQRGVRKALRIHKALGNPIAVWENGKVVWIPPEKIVVEDD